MNVPEKHRAVAHKWVDGAEVESTLMGNSDWQIDEFPKWHEHLKYRVKPTNSSIDWSHISNEIVAMATDMNGRTYLFTEIPRPARHWWLGQGKFPATRLTSFKPGNRDWRDSLVVRPGYKEGRKRRIKPTLCYPK